MEELPDGAHEENQNRSNQDSLSGDSPFIRAIISPPRGSQSLARSSSPEDERSSSRVMGDLYYNCCNLTAGTAEPLRHAQRPRNLPGTGWGPLRDSQGQRSRKGARAVPNPLVFFNRITASHRSGNA